jgi:hypothetical protein
VDRRGTHKGRRFISFGGAEATGAMEDTLRKGYVQRGAGRRRLRGVLDERKSIIEQI